LKLLLDTHIWLWSLAEPGKLSKSALSRVENELWVSSISVWELLILAERGGVKLDDEPRRWVVEALDRTPAQEAVLTFEVAVRSREIMLAHPDPADRVLVAAALIYDLTLVAADDALTVAKSCPVLVNH
jgi:PIN domain nuclease of toxin-antitoxin system